MSSALKFLHAADLHLDRPITGLAEIPVHLKETLANAPYLAAERLFDLAINERVDFVLLAGDVVDLDQGGPRCAAFLLGQFERLAGKNIHVYWCGGSVDQPDRWPSAIPLPDNLTVFSSSMVEQAVHHRDGKDIATICGAGVDNHRRKTSDFRCPKESAFAIALMHGDLDTSGMASQNIRYWALGGQHQRKVIDKSATLAVYPGTTQSRCPGESGGYGCTMVTLDAQGTIRLREFELDSVRWIQKKITVAENAKTSDLKDSLGDRCSKARSEYPDQLLLTKWQVSTTGDYNSRLRNPEWKSELLAWLRDEFGQSACGLWTVELQIDPPRSLPADWYEEETILGDYLRAIGTFQGDTAMALSVSEYLPDCPVEDEWLSALGRIPVESRELILKKAALAGVDYLAITENDHQDPV